MDTASVANAGLNSLNPLIPPPQKPFDGAAFYGLAGEIVEAIAPNTESDPAAILLQLLVSIGALIGRGPHVPIEGDQHHSNLFIVIVGTTGKGRKGTSWGRVRQIMEGVPGWPNVVSGLSSGEGLKWHVRDAATRTELDHKTGFSKTVETDPGISDKRLLVIESEFAQVLRQAGRAGNTLSATLRPAWDTGTLRTLTKNDPVIATDTHINIIGHITAEELKKELTATDIANGFANRFIYTVANRANVLPFGGDKLDEALLQGFREKISYAATQARMCGAFAMTQSARNLWSDVYPELSEGRPGLLGAITARAEAQCLRLALIYALLDCAKEIDFQHLVAALTVWERSMQSALQIFGGTIGSKLTDDILQIITNSSSAGVTRTQINRRLSGHKTSGEISTSLELLRSKGLAHVIPMNTGGAPLEVWFPGTAE